MTKLREIIVMGVLGMALFTLARGFQKNQTIEGEVLWNDMSFVEPLSTFSKDPGYFVNIGVKTEDPQPCEFRYYFCVDKEKMANYLHKSVTNEDKVLVDTSFFGNRYSWPRKVNDLE